MAEHRDCEKGIRRTLRELKSCRKVTEDKHDRLFASRTARLIKLTRSPLSDTDMKTSTGEEAQQFAISEIQAIDLRINDIVCDIYFL